MANTYLNKTLGTATNRKKFTISVWFKKCNNSNAQYLASAGTDVSSVIDDLSIHSSQALNFSGYESGTTYGLRTNALLRDNSAWYHAVVSFDSTQTTSTDRLKMYLSGEEITSFSSTTYPSLNLEVQFNKNVEHMVGRNLGGTNYFNGSMSHIHFIDGTAYDATAFGEYDANGVWKIKTSPSVTYGTNGFFILKDGNSVTDQSGNSNNFTVGGGTLTKTEDSPSNVFATMNVLSKGSGISISNGNTTISNGSGDKSIVGTIACASGKYYWEAKCTNATTYANIGVTLSSADGSTHSSVDAGRIAYENGGSVYREGLSGQGNTSGLATFTTNDIISVAFDTENGTLSFYKNGTLINTTTDNDLLFSNNEYLPCNGINNGGWSYNFGNGYFGTTAVSSAGTNASGIGIFEYDVPTGYTALSTKGLNL